MKLKIKELEKHLKQLKDNINDNYYGGSVLLINDSLDALSVIEHLANGVTTGDELVLPIQSVVTSTLPEDEENEPYCTDCGNEDLAYIDQYANGNYWRCKECGKQFIH